MTSLSMVEEQPLLQENQIEMWSAPKEFRCMMYGGKTARANPAQVWRPLLSCWAVSMNGQGVSGWCVIVEVGQDGSYKDIGPGIAIHY